MEWVNKKYWDSKIRDDNRSGLGRVDQKPNPQKNIVGLNLTPKPAGEICHPNPLGVGSCSGARRVL
jgi:hypothetical protein